MRHGGLFAIGVAVLVGGVLWGAMAAQAEGAGRADATATTTPTTPEAPDTGCTGVVQINFRWRDETIRDALKELALRSDDSVRCAHSLTGQVAAAQQVLRQLYELRRFTAAHFAVPKCERPGMDPQTAQAQAEAFTGCLAAAQKRQKAALLTFKERNDRLTQAVRQDMANITIFAFADMHRDMMRKASGRIEAAQGRLDADLGWYARWQARMARKSPAQ